MKRTASLRALAVAAVTTVLVGIVAAPASADDLSGGTWYFEKGHVQEALDAGFTGKGVKIAVLDSQINPAIPTLRNANLTVIDKSYCHDATGAPLPAVSTDEVGGYHGTGVASLIVGTGETGPGQVPIRGVAPDAHVLYYNADQTIDAEGKTQCLDAAGKDRGMDAVAEAMNDAMDAHADIISISIGGPYSEDLFRALARAVMLGIPVIGGLTNDPLSTTGAFPAEANGSVAVQAIDATGAVQKAGGFSNRSMAVKIAAPGVGIIAPAANDSGDPQWIGQGTSLATPIVAGFLADIKSKHPTATGNQLLQTMIRNTGGTHHEPAWGNDLGYGTISLTRMRADDPLAYEDVNPFFDPKVTSAAEGPTADDVRAAKSAEALRPASGSSVTPAPTAKPAADGVRADTPIWVPLVIGGGVLMLLIIAGAVIAVVGARRRNSSGPAQTDEESTSNGDHFMHAPTGVGSGADQGGNR